MSAVSGLRALFDPPAASATTYVRDSNFGVLAILLLVAIVPDAFLLSILVPHGLWWVGALATLSEVWAALWAADAYGAMAAMPHEFGADAVTFRYGKFACASVPYAAIVGATVSTWPRTCSRAERDGRALVGSRRGTLVKLNLDAPVTVEGLRRTTARTLYVSSDKPAWLLARLEALRGAPGTAIST